MRIDIHTHYRTAEYLETMERLGAFQEISAFGILRTQIRSLVGVILNLSLWFGLHVLFGEVKRIAVVPSFGPGMSWPVWTTLDPFATGLLVLSLLMLMRWKVGMVPVLALGIAGGVLRLWLM